MKLAFGFYDDKGMLLIAGGLQYVAFGIQLVDLGDFLPAGGWLSGLGPVGKIKVSRAGSEPAVRLMRGKYAVPLLPGTSSRFYYLVGDSRP